MKMNVDTSHSATRLNWLQILLLFVIGPILGSALGAITNSVDGYVSPKYFQEVMRWRSSDDPLRMSIRQGIIEGACYGLYFGGLFLILALAILVGNAAFSLTCAMQC
jgi:hypothetical protein